MGKISVRYIVSDVDTAIPFYIDMLGFKLDMHPAPGFAALSRGDLQLLLNRPGAGGAGQAVRDGQLPAPGGWNRIQIEVEDLEATVEKLKRMGRAVPQRDRHRQRREANPDRGSVRQFGRAVPALLNAIRAAAPNCRRGLH